MTNDERDRLDRTQVSLGKMHRELCAANADNRSLRRWLHGTLAVLIVVVGIMGMFWPRTDVACTVEAMGQERAGDMVAMQAVTSWYRGQVAHWEGQAARRVSAERELAEVLASRVKWNTAGNGPLDLPPLTMEQAKKRLIAYEELPHVKEDTLVEPRPVSISQRLMQALGAEAMKGVRMMGMRP